MEIIGALGLFGVLTFILLVVIMPISVYAAQKWAYKCYREVERTNELLERLTKETRKLRSGDAEKAPYQKHRRQLTRSCPNCGRRAFPQPNGTCENCGTLIA